MKVNRVFLSVLVTALLSVMTLTAQTGKASGTPWGHGEDSIRCREAISLLTSYSKSGNFADAKEFWERAYNECPGSSKNIYIYAPRILGWEISQAKDAKTKEELVKKLLEVYDTRAVYFGDDPKYGKDWILAQKITEYMKYTPTDKLNYDEIYSWTKPVVDEMKEKTEPQVVYFYVFSSLNKAIGNKAWHETYVNDYMLGNDYLEKDLEQADSSQDSVSYNYVSNLKEQLDLLFAKSGLADCNMLVEIFGKNLEENKNNPSFLQALLDMFRYAGCEKQKVYFTASKYMFSIKPTASAAIGLAKEAQDANKSAEAFNYLTKALELTKDHKLRSSIYLMMAVNKKDANSYSEARKYCNEALKENPNAGTAYLLIAQMYASTASSIFPDDAVKARCVYFLVIDKLEKAAALDPSVASEARRLISIYRRNLPSSADIFMHPDMEKGKSFYVGGWIGESTVIR